MLPLLQPLLPSPHPSEFDFLFKLATDGFCCLQPKALTDIEASDQKGEFYQRFPRTDTDKTKVGEPCGTETLLRSRGWRVERGVRWEQEVS